MSSGQPLKRIATAAAVAVTLSGCALPPIVTAVTLGADIFSLSETGKTVTDHGISLVMDQDCALLRVFDGAVCRAGEDTPQGALVALTPLADPAMDPAAGDPMTVPVSLAYLDGALGLAVAGGPAATGPQVPAAAFASLRDELAGGRAAAGTGIAPGDGLSYLAAAIGG